MNLKNKWNYSRLAKHYDHRADYCKTLINKIFKTIDSSYLEDVIDIGAGTGKLTKIIISKCKKVTAVEPNSAMRQIGIKNLQNKCHWVNGTAEKTNTNKKFTMCFFGSSFNVINHKKTIKELKSILHKDSLVFIIFNYRNLENKIQLKIEDIIKSNIKNYNYGLRRKNLKDFLKNFDNFSQIKIYKKNFFVKMNSKNFIDGFKSHATILNQANYKFNSIINKIKNYVSSLKRKNILIPYTTVVYLAKFKH